jgi:hypothetical protein
MENLSTMESFKSFQVSKQSMNKVLGGRTKYFDDIEGCAKVIDNNYNEITKVKYADRFDDNC